MAASIYLKSITKKINNATVIADLDIGLQKGDTLAIIGNNDSGKSTLLKLLSGILDADSGEIFLNGDKLSSKNYELRKSISYVPEYIDFDNSSAKKAKILLDNIANIFWWSSRWINL